MPRISYTGPGKNIPMGTINKHRKPYPILAKEVIRVCDIILEVLDARFIEDTRNLELESLIKKQGKKIIYIINKVDLINIRDLLKSGQLRNLKPYILISCKQNIGRTHLRTAIKIAVKRIRKEHADIILKAKQGLITLDGKLKEQIIKVDKRAHVGIIGYPNTGKSALTNILTGSGAANASSESGFTKGIQKVKLSRDILILDSPGVISEDENSTVNAEDLQKHAKIGVRTYDKTKEPEFIVHSLFQEHQSKFESFYGLKVDEKGDSEILLGILGRKWGFLVKGNAVDRDKTARRILKDWQNGDIMKN